VLNSQQWARIRFGVGNDFPKGSQVDFVLGQFPPEEAEKVDERAAVACDMIKAFCLSGLTFAMNNYNNK
jgi:peptidyl-tRNA hydrolase, PTH1 family